ncbi:MAG: hypothetical protein J5903_00090 [Clostridia bacterium]|nr:hypothetical protein [Clostridia bacterium]
MEEIKEENNLKNPKTATLVAAILNTVCAVICFGMILGAILVINFVDIQNKSDTANEAIGIIFVVLLVLPLVLITLFPACIAGGILFTARAVIYYFQLSSGKKSGKGIVIFSLIMKILIAVPELFGGLMFGAIWGDSNALITASLFVVGALGVVAGFVSTGFEFAATK